MRTAPDAARKALLEFDTRSRAFVCSQDDELCKAAERHEDLFVTVALWPEQRALLEAFAFAAAAVQTHALALIAGDEPATHAAAAMVCNQFVRVATLPAVPAAFGESSSRLILSRKWGAIDALLGRGVRVLYADVDVVLTHPPFWLASNDSDVEASSEAWDAEAARGFIHVSPEPAAALKPSPSLALLALLSVHAAPVTSESHHRVPPATGSG